MSITFPKRLFISLHFAKKPHENRSGESRITVCQMLYVGVKIKSCRNSISRKLNSIDCIELKKGVKCAVRLDQC